MLEYRNYVVHNLDRTMIFANNYCNEWKDEDFNKNDVKVNFDNEE